MCSTAICMVCEYYACIFVYPRLLYRMWPCSQTLSVLTCLTFEPPWLCACLWVQRLYYMLRESLGVRLATCRTGLKYDNVLVSRMHIAWHLHTCNCRYLDDLPALEGELYAGLVLSRHSHASITVDYSAALAMEGVVDYVGIKDLPGSNMIGMYSVHVLVTWTYTV